MSAAPSAGVPVPSHPARDGTGALSRPQWMGEHPRDVAAWLEAEHEGRPYHRGSGSTDPHFVSTVTTPHGPVHYVGAQFDLGVALITANLEATLHA